MNATKNLLTNLCNLPVCACEAFQYGLTFLRAILCSKAVLAAKLLAVESQLAACKQRIDSKKRRWPRFTASFRLLWVVLSKFLDGEPYYLASETTLNRQGKSPGYDHPILALKSAVAAFGTGDRIEEGSSSLWRGSRERPWFGAPLKLSPRRSVTADDPFPSARSSELCTANRAVGFPPHLGRKDAMSQHLLSIKTMVFSWFLQASCWPCRH